MKNKKTNYNPKLEILKKNYYPSLKEKKHLNLTLNPGIMNNKNKNQNSKLIALPLRLKILPP